MTSDPVERLLIVPQRAKERDAAEYHAVSAIRVYDAPQDFPPIVVAIMSVFTLLAFALAGGWIGLQVLAHVGCWLARAC